MSLSSRVSKEDADEEANGESAVSNISFTIFYSEIGKDLASRLNTTQARYFFLNGHNKMTLHRHAI